LIRASLQRNSVGDDVVVGQADDVRIRTLFVI